MAQRKTNILFNDLFCLSRADAVIFGQKFSSPARQQIQPFHCLHRLLIYMRILLSTPLLSLGLVSAVSAFIAVLSSAGTALMRSTRHFALLPLQYVHWHQKRQRDEGPLTS